MGKKKLRSIGELAQIAGVSKSTVSRALNGSPLIGTETTARIRVIAQEYGFRPSETARRLSLRSSGTIAFVTHPSHKDAFTVCDMFSIEIMGAVARGLREHQYDLLMVEVDPRDDDWPAQYLDTGKVDGFVLMTSTRKIDHIENLIRLGAPFVAWGRGNGRFSSVSGDDRAGGRLAAEHMLNAGRGRIATICGPPEEPEVGERLEGYYDALRNAGIEPDPELVAYGDYTESSGYAAMEELLEQGPVEGIAVHSDLMAIAAMRCLRKHGLRVPEDVAVVGYDDLSIAARAVPALTTVSQNLPLAGSLLARDLINHLKTRAVTQTTVPVALVVRDSA